MSAQTIIEGYFLLNLIIKDYIEFNFTDKYVCFIIDIQNIIFLTMAKRAVAVSIITINGNFWYFDKISNCNAKKKLREYTHGRFSAILSERDNFEGFLFAFF